jgi:hypothetical protein
MAMDDRVCKKTFRENFQESELGENTEKSGQRVGGKQKRAVP